MAEAIDKAPQEKVKEAVVKEVSEFQQLATDGAAELQAEINRIVTKYSDPNTYKKMLEDIITKAWTTITTAYATLSTTVANLLVSITNQLTAVSIVFTGTGSGIAGQLAQINNLNDVITLVNWVIDNVTFMVDTITGLVDEIIATVNTIINTAVNVGVGLLKDAEDAVTGAITDIFEGPAAIIDKHLNKITEKATDVIDKSLNAETLIETLTGRKPGEEDFITTIEAFGGKLTEDQDRHGLAKKITTEARVLLGG